MSEQQAEGPPPVFIAPLLPECANDLYTGDATPEGAIEFQPDDRSYWVQNVLKSTVPGLVLGILCAIAMISLIIWTIIRFCGCCCTRKRNTLSEGQGSVSQDMENSQFIAPSQNKYSDSRHYEIDSRGYFDDNASAWRTKDQINAQFGLPKDLTCMERFKVKVLLKWSIVLMMLATVGVASWGIYASVKHTENVLPGFWEVYGQVQDIAGTVFDLLNRLSKSVNSADKSLNVLVGKQDQLITLLESPAIKQSLGYISGALNELGPIAQILQEVKGPLQQAAVVSNSTFISGLSEFREDVEPPTLAFQEVWRFVAIAVVFGLVILFSILSSVLAVWGRLPRLVATSTILLWFMTALLMLLGVGVLNGVQYVTDDGCLYAESFVFNYATNYISPDAAEYATKAINYYIDQSASNEYVPGQALTQIVDPLAAQLLYISQEPAIDAFLKALPTLVNSNSLPTALGKDTNDALVAVSEQVPALQQLLFDIDKAASRSNVNALYLSTKEYVCCSLSGDLSNLYAAWVATGVLSLILAIVVTWRLLWFVKEQQSEANGH
jgi:hypothetical protein